MDIATCSARVRDSTIAIGGLTYGDWNMTNRGEADFIAFGLDPADGTERWRWQVREDVGVITDLGLQVL